MIGNVSEWVQDCFHGSYAGAPADGSPWIEGSCVKRILRGGNYMHMPSRSAERDRDAQGQRFWVVGFRLARTLP